MKQEFIVERHKTIPPNVCPPKAFDACGVWNKLDDCELAPKPVPVLRPKENPKKWKIKHDLLAYQII